MRAGKARYVGCSNYLAYQVARALGRSEVLGLARFDSVQPRYNLLFRQIERELLPLCQEEGIGVIPYNPIAGGLLSGKHRSRSGPDGGHALHARHARPRRYQERYWHEREFDTVEALRPLAAEAGMPLARSPSPWVLAHPGHHVAHRRRQPPRAARRASPRRREAARRRPQGAPRRAHRASTAGATTCADARLPVTCVTHSLTVVFQ